MKYSINSKVLADALGRCTTVSDGYALTFTNRPVKKDNVETGEVYATISASTSSGISAMSSITVAVTNEVSADAGALNVIVGTDFAEAAKALCKAGETVTFTVKDNSLELSYGDAKIEVGRKDKVTNFAVKSPRKDSHAKFQVETKEWKRVIQQTAFACGSYDPTGDKAALNNILLLPCIVGDEYGIRTCSANAFCGSSSHCIVKEKDEAFVEMVNAVKGVLLPPAMVKSLTGVLKGDIVTVFIFDNQLMIRDGNDVFAMVLAEGAFPMHLLPMIDDAEYAYLLKADTAELKVALDIVSVNCTDPNKSAMKLEIGENGVTLFAKETANRAPVKATTEGAVEIGLSIKQLKDLINSGITEVNQVTICGKNNTSIIHVRGGHCNAFTFPVLLSMLDNEN